MRRNPGRRLLYLFCVWSNQLHFFTQKTHTLWMSSYLEMLRSLLVLLNPFTFVVSFFVYSFVSLEIVCSSISLSLSVSILLPDYLNICLISSNVTQRLSLLDTNLNSKFYKSGGNKVFVETRFCAWMAKSREKYTRKLETTTMRLLKESRLEGKHGELGDNRRRMFWKYEKVSEPYGLQSILLLLFFKVCYYHNTHNKKYWSRSYKNTQAKNECRNGQTNKWTKQAI